MKTLSVQCRIPLTTLAQLALEAESNGRAIRSKSTLIVQAALHYASSCEPIDEETAQGVLERIFSDEVLRTSTAPVSPDIHSVIASTMRTLQDANTISE